MRIGILTYHCPPNFGAQLQAISMVGYLKRVGHDPIVINWYPKDLESYYAQHIPKKQIECHKQFTQQAFPLTPLIRTEGELISIIKNIRLDAIISGSDALFKYIPEKKRRYFDFRKMKYVKREPLSCMQLKGNPFWGDFLSKLGRKIPAIAFSVSSQNCPFTEMSFAERNTMGRYLEHYKYITVRDIWTKEMVNTVSSHKNVVVTPDPVFSFNNNTYLDVPSKDLICKKYSLPSDYVLISFTGRYLGVEYIKEVSRCLRKVNLCPVALPMPEGVLCSGNEMKIDVPLSPLEWYALISHSKGYIGERMHPIVVCLHNSVPFYAFDYYGIKYRSPFTLKRKVKKTSSKTYLIVEDAGFLDNIFTYFSDKKQPSADQVVSRLLNFDKEKSESFSRHKQSYFEESLNIALAELFK